jgi:hypothetical protein
MSLLAPRTNDKTSLALRIGSLALAVILALVLVSCGDDGEGGGSEDRPSLSLTDESSDVAAPEAEAPEAEAPDSSSSSEPSETPPPSETTGADDGEADSDVPVWVWVILGLLVVGVVAWFGARAGSKRSSSDQPAAVEDWRSSARSAYSDSRWLYDELDAPLARWRGDVLFDARQADAGSSAAAANQAAWNQLPARMDAAREALYRLEGAAPNAEVSRLANDLLNQLTTTRTAVDTLADAHRARRAAEADTSTPAEDLERAQAAESEAANALDAGRHRLRETMLSFSAAT